MTPIDWRIVPAPGVECAAYAEHLPLVAQRLLSHGEEARVRAHAATCEHCKALLAAYDRLDVALRAGIDRAGGNAPLAGEIVEIVEQQEFGTPSAAPQGVEPARMRQPRRVFSLIGAVAAVVMVALLAQALFANGRGSHAGAPSTDVNQWAQANDGLPPGLTAVYSSMTMVSPNDGWLFGITYPDSTSSGGTCAQCGPFALRYNGTTWHKTPAPPVGDITGVSMLSSTDGWAISENIILRYTAGAWQVADRYMVPNETIYLTTIAMVSPTEGWIGGSDDSGTSQDSFFLHYTAGQWQRVAAPGAPGFHTLGINSIAMLTADDGWAVEPAIREGSGTMATLLLHYGNGAWHTVGAPVDATLTSVSGISSRLAWMVGAATGITGGIFQYYDGQILQIYSPTPNILHAVTMISPTDGWAVGDGAATLHWDGTQWTKVGFVIHGVALMGVAFTSPGEGWAVGNALNVGSNVPLMLHYSGGTWSVYPLKIGG